MATIPPFPDADWHTAVQRAVARAREDYPTLGTRLEKAQALVLAGGVERSKDPVGAYMVTSQSDPTGLRTYTVQGRKCTCEDFRQKAASEDLTYWCKHLVAVWVYRKAKEVTLPVHRPAIPLAACPEAAISLTLTGQVDGLEARLTIRGQTLEQFARNLAGVRDMLQLNAPTSRENAPIGSAAEWVCKYHGKALASTKVPGQRYCPAKLADGTRCTETSTK